MRFRPQNPAFPEGPKAGLRSHKSPGSPAPRRRSRLLDFGPTQSYFTAPERVHDTRGLRGRSSVG
jgi:hypothetical protein